jgi:hypothetical protein
MKYATGRETEGSNGENGPKRCVWRRLSVVWALGKGLDCIYNTSTPPSNDERPETRLGPQVSPLHLHTTYVEPSDDERARDMVGVFFLLIFTVLIVNLLLVYACRHYLTVAGARDASRDLVFFSFFFCFTKLFVLFIVSVYGHQHHHQSTQRGPNTG